MNSSINTSLTCAVLALTTLATSATHAEDSLFSGLKVGINAIYSDKGFTEYDNQVAILPSAFFDNGSVYARGNHIGYNLIKDEQNEVSVFAQYGGASFDHKNANNAYHNLNDRDASIFAGASYLHVTPYGGLRAQIATEAMGDSDGTLGRLTYIGRYKSGDLTLVPSVGIQWQDDNYNDYYYGVTAKESTKTGINKYSANASTHPYANVMGMYDLNNKWTLFANQNIAYNTDEIYNSPKVDNRTTFASTLGIMYNF